MDKEKFEKLQGAYRRALNTAEGEAVLKDLAIFCGLSPDPEGLKRNEMTHWAGQNLSHAECAYRNGMQDLFRYIESYVAE